MQANSVARVAKVVHSYIVDVGIDKVTSWFIVSGLHLLLEAVYLEWFHVHRRHNASDDFIDDFSSL